MLKRLGAFGTMDAAEIKALRAMLASEAAARARSKRGPGVLGRLFVRAPANAEHPAPPPPAEGRDAAPLDLDGDLDVDADPDLAAPLFSYEPGPTASAPMDGVAAALHIGALAPRRTAFGQRRAVRREIVLDLLEPASIEPARLLLTSRGRAPIGAIVLRSGEGSETEPRRPPPEPLHAVTPFFPEDLEDRPGAALRAFRALPPAPSAGRPARTPAPKAGPEMAATFLLAKLAARLAYEQASLSARIAALDPMFA